MPESSIAEISEPRAELDIPLPLPVPPGRMVLVPSRGVVGADVPMIGTPFLLPPLADDDRDDAGSETVDDSDEATDVLGDGEYPAAAGAVTGL